MYSTSTAGISSIVVVLIGAAAIGAGALMSNNESRPLSSVAMNASSTEASSTVAISVAEDEALQSSSTRSVTYTSAGFSPQQLTIPIGTTVQFKSVSATEMWVASASSSESGSTITDDCLNLSDDSIDQCEVGSEFSFTFQKVGEFNYRNQQNPEHGGTIIVTEE